MFVAFIPESTDSPLTVNPDESTFNLSIVPAAIITVSDISEVPNALPIIVLLLPVVTAQPA